MDAKSTPQLAVTLQSPYTGSSPWFVLYQNGQVIYRLERRQYATVFLTPGEQQALLTRLPLKEFHQLKSSYSIADATDLPLNFITWWSEERSKTVMVDGSLSRCDEATLTRAGLMPFATIYHMLTTFRHEQAQPWLPDQLEVKVWTAFAQPEGSFLWPADWPDLYHPQTQKNKYAAVDSYTLYIDTAHLTQLEALRLSVQPVLMNDRLWHLTYDLWLPHENEIRAAFYRR